jgi:hypothetical protein
VAHGYDSINFKVTRYLIVTEPCRRRPYLAARQEQILVAAPVVTGSQSERTASSQATRAFRQSPQRAKKTSPQIRWQFRRLLS